MFNKILVVLIISGTMWANDAVFKGNGKDLRPVRETNVQMVSELIYITYGKGLGFEVEVIATFKNKGNATDLQVGFPFKVYYPGIEKDSLGFIRENFDPHFKVYADGIELPTNMNYSKNYSEEYNVIYLFNLHFGKNETKILRHKYTVGGTYFSQGGWEFEYVLKTGALWNGNIESIAIVLEIPVEKVQKFQTVWPREKNVFSRGNKIFLTWKYENIKPDFNLKLGGFSNYLNGMRPEDLLNKVDSNKIQLYRPGYRRYLINLIFARYGYPFKNPFVRAQFYFKNKIMKKITFKPRKDFNIKDVPQKYLVLVKKLRNKLR